MRINRVVIYLLICSAFIFEGSLSAMTKGDDNSSEQTETQKENTSIDVQQIIFDHMLDSYEWHIAGDFAVHLPVILYSKKSGWHIFSSKHLHHHGHYKNFYPAGIDSPRAGKLMEKMEDGTFVRPLDLSFTKIALALFIDALVLLLLILPAARWYRKRRSPDAVPSKFVAMIEGVVMYIEDSLIRSCVGKNYKRFSPYLLTLFFFILTCNLMSLIPFFPGGVGVTANMTITMFLAICTFIAINIWGSREYWKEILWPDVPMFLKAPFPMIQIIEFLGLFTKPIALMVRLFANMMGGHMAMLVLTILIFIGFSVSKVLGSSMTFLSVAFNIFLNLLELLVAFIQAYVFTLLSAVFIGGAQIEEHAVKEEIIKNEE